MDAAVTKVRREILRQQPAARLNAARDIVHDVERIKRPARPALLLQLAPAADAVGRAVKDFRHIGIILCRTCSLTRRVMQLLIRMRHAAYAPRDIAAQTGLPAPAAQRLQKRADRYHELLRDHQICAHGKRQLHARADAQLRKRDAKQRQQVRRREYEQIKPTPMLAKLPGQQPGSGIDDREQDARTGGHVHGDAEDQPGRCPTQRAARPAEDEQNEHRERPADRQRVEQQQIVHAHEQTRQQKHGRDIAADLRIDRARLLRAQQIVKPIGRCGAQQQKQYHAGHQQQRQAAREQTQHQPRQYVSRRGDSRRIPARLHKRMTAQKICRQKNQAAAGGELRAGRNAEGRKVAERAAGKAQRAAGAIPHRRQERQTERRRRPGDMRR